MIWEIQIRMKLKDAWAAFTYPKNGSQIEVANAKTVKRNLNHAVVNNPWWECEDYRILPLNGTSAIALPARIGAEIGIDDGVRDSVAHLVRMSFRYGFAGKHEILSGHWSPFRTHAGRTGEDGAPAHRRASVEPAPGGRDD